MPTVPEIAYTNTVLKKTYDDVLINQPWVMFLNGVDPKSDVQVYRQEPGSSQITLIPPAQYGITVVSASPWEFTLQYTSPPPTPEFIVIFRRVISVFEDFQPGAFLNADTLNAAFNIETLAATDLTYYQEKSRPGYDDQQIAEHGEWVPPTGPQTDDSNVKLEDSNYKLPYLASSPTVVQDDIYVWGYKVSAPPGGGNPRVGSFVDVLLTSAGDPTAGQLKQDLARQCVPPNDEGSRLIGTCITSINGTGWTATPGLNLTEYLGNLKHADFNAPAENGAQFIGVGINAGVHPGNYTLENYLLKLPQLGTAGNYAATAGASYIGYGGWNVSNDTVAGCLSRLNEVATSSADSGAEYVKWWSPNGLGSQSVQEGLERLADITILSNVMAPAIVNILVGILPAVLVANPSWIDRIVYSVRTTAGSGGLVNNVVTTQINNITSLPYTTRIFPFYTNPAGAPVGILFEINPIGQISASKPSGAFPAGNLQEVKATIYLKADR